MASAEVLNPFETRLGPSDLGFPTYANSLTTIGWDEWSRRLSGKVILETRLSLIAHTWVELCASLEVRIDLESPSASLVHGNGHERTVTRKLQLFVQPREAGSGTCIPEPSVESEKLLLGLCNLPSVLLFAS